MVILNSPRLEHKYRVAFAWISLFNWKIAQTALRTPFLRELISQKMDFFAAYGPLIFTMTVSQKMWLDKNVTSLFSSLKMTRFDQFPLSFSQQL